MTTSPRNTTNTAAACIELEVGAFALECVKGLAGAAAEMDCAGDERAQKQVSLLLCCGLIAAQEWGSDIDLNEIFYHLDAVLQAAENVPGEPLHPQRAGLVGCARAICQQAVEVTGHNSGRYRMEMLMSLLHPYALGTIDSLRQRVHEACEASLLHHEGISA